MNLKLPARVACLLGAVLLLAAGRPAFGRDLVCEFQATGLALAFGNLDPSNAVQVTKAVTAVNTNADRVGDCNALGATLTVQVIGASSRQLTNLATGASIPYSIGGYPVTLAQPGNNRYALFLNAAMVGVIPAGSYADAPAGLYQDTVTISVTP